MTQHPQTHQLWMKPFLPSWDEFGYINLGAFFKKKLPTLLSFQVLKQKNYLTPPFY
jgi:hypothetical protein